MIGSAAVAPVLSDSTIQYGSSSEALRADAVPAILRSAVRYPTAVLRAAGVPAVSGDASEPEVLVQAHVAIDVGAYAGKAGALYIVGTTAGGYFDVNAGGVTAQGAVVAGTVSLQNHVHTASGGSGNSSSVAMAVLPSARS